MTFLYGSPLQEGTRDWGLLANLMTPVWGVIFFTKEPPEKSQWKCFMFMAGQPTPLTHPPQK